MQKLQIEDWNAHGLAVRRFRRWDADRDGRWEATSWKNLVGLLHYLSDISKTQLAWISVSETQATVSLLSTLCSVHFSALFSSLFSSLLKSSLQISLRLLLYSFNYSTYTLFKPSLSISRKLGSFSSKLLLAKLLRHDSSQPNTNHPITRFPGLSLQSDFRMIRCNLLSRHLLSSYISPSISSA